MLRHLVTAARSDLKIFVTHLIIIMGDAPFGAFMINKELDFVEILEFAQFRNLDVRDFKVFDINILAVYSEADFLIMLQWLYNPSQRYSYAEYLVF